MSENHVPWQAVRGTLLHRCVLHCANKWYAVVTEDHRTEFIEQARWMAEQLQTALESENYGDAAALADAGGPYWSRVVDDFRALGPMDQDCVMDGLAGHAVRAAQELMEQAVEDDWRALLSEVSDPYAYLLTGDRGRMDLIVKRGDVGAPLVVDLKFGSRAWSVDRLEDEVHEVGEKYAAPAAQRLGRKVVAVVLNVPAHDDPQWSRHEVRGPAD